MGIETTYQQAIDLTQQALGITSGLDLPRGKQWPTIVTVFLNQANELLAAVQLDLDNQLWNSGVILTRSLFEFGVNLNYINKDKETRLTEYLSHGRIPPLTEETNQLPDAREATEPPNAKDLIPKNAWRSLKEMCGDLGSNWPGTYETFYRYASIPTHAGSFTLGQNYMRLLNQEPPSDHEKASVLLTALDFHLCVALVAAGEFSGQMDVKTIADLYCECGTLGKKLASQQG